jgi:hypothetical protein
MSQNNITELYSLFPTFNAHVLFTYLFVFGFAYSGVQHILCCGFVLFVSVYVASFCRLSIFDCPFGIL